MISPFPPRLVTFFCLSLALAACNSAEENAEESYQSALTLLEEGDAERAMVELRNALQFDDNHRESRALMAEILYEQGEERAAYGQYLRLAEQDPDDLESRVLLGEIAFSLRNWEELERHGAAAEALAPDDPRVEVLSLARAYRQAVIDEEPTRREGVGVAAVEMLAARPGDDVLRNIAVDHYSRTGDFEAALAETDTLIAADPDDRLLYNQRIALLAQLGEESRIEAALREVVDLFPADSEAKANLLRFYLSRQEIDAAEEFLREFADPAAEDPGPFIDLVRFLNEVRGADAARAELDRAVAENPNPRPFVALRAALDFGEGREEEAIAALEGLLVDAEPTDETNGIRITLARFYLGRGNNVGARTLVEEVLADDPTQVEALKMQAAWQIEEDKTDEAIFGLRSALDRAPEDTDAMQLMAQAHARAGNIDLARDFLALAVEASGNAPGPTLRYARVLIDEERYLPAEDVLIPALRLDPENTDLLSLLGELYLRMEDIPRTQQVIATLRRFDTAPATAIANTLDMQRLAQTGGEEEALAFIEALAGEEGSDLNAQLLLLRGRIATGDSDGAMALIDGLLAEDPESERLALIRAAVLAVTGDLDGAAAGYEAFLEDNPRIGRVWLELSRIHLRQGRSAAAAAAIEEGLDQVPGDPNLLWAKASVLENENDIDGAIAIYEDLYARDSSSVIVANNLASLLSTHRDDEDSLDRAYTIARRLANADNPALQDTYGWIVFRRGEVEEALPYLEAAAAGLSEDPIVQYHLAAAYAAQDRTEEAIAQFQRVLEVAGPGDTRPQIATARAELARLRAAAEEAPSDAENATD